MDFGASWAAPGHLLGRLGGVLGASWGVLRKSWGRLGVLGCLRGPRIWIVLQNGSKLMHCILAGSFKWIFGRFSFSTSNRNFQLKYSPLVSTWF